MPQCGPLRFIFRHGEGVPHVLESDKLWRLRGTATLSAIELASFFVADPRTPVRKALPDSGARAHRLVPAAARRLADSVAQVILLKLYLTRGWRWCSDGCQSIPRIIRANTAWDGVSGFQPHVPPFYVRHCSLGETLTVERIITP